MPLSICTSCMSRLRLSSHTSIAPPAILSISKSSFHSSSSHQGDGQASKKKRATGKNVYRNTALQTYKKKRRVVPKTPPIGERQMLRKRIVLSNTNAVEIKDMQDLSARNMNDDAYVGHVLGIEGSVIDQLRHAKAFKRSQNWRLFRQPATLFRKETLELGKNFELVNESQSGSDNQAKVLRQVVTGERISGKSVLLIQALSMAFMDKWIVINVPEAQDFILSHSSYAPIPRAADSDEERQYIQPHLAAELLSRAALTNQNVLQKLRLNHPLPKSLSGRTQPDTLLDLARLGAGNPTLAHETWQHFLKELTSPGENPRPPTLIAIDGLDHWMGPTRYRAADYSLIHAHQFALIKQLLSLLFSDIPLHHGGIVIGATTKSNGPVYPTFEVLLKQIAALNEGIQLTDENFPMPTPYQKVDPKVLSLLPTSSSHTNTTTITHLKGLSLPESAGLLRYFNNSGILKASITDTFIGEKWTIASRGIVGELCKAGIGGMGVRLDPGKTVTTFGTLEGVRVGRGEHKPKG